MFGGSCVEASRREGPIAGTINIALYGVWEET